MRRGISKRRHAKMADWNCMTQIHFIDTKETIDMDGDWVEYLKNNSNGNIRKWQFFANGLLINMDAVKYVKVVKTK